MFTHVYSRIHALRLLAERVMALRLEQLVNH